MTTQQEIFNRSRDHLLSQRARSTVDLPEFCVDSGSAGCVYRRDDGLMCAVGVFIPDEAYSSDLEGLNADDLCEMAGREGDVGAELPVAIFNRGNADLLSRLQMVHDNHPVDMWEEKLAEVAAKFGLVP